VIVSSWGHGDESLAPQEPRAEQATAAAVPKRGDTGECHHACAFTRAKGRVAGDQIEEQDVGGEPASAAPPSSRE
jgi:hypothetical protein